MADIRQFLAAMCIWAVPTVSSAAPPAGMLAEWRFDEGQGEVARDASGNGHDAKIHGAAWVKQADGFALSFDGYDDYVDCGESKKLEVNGPVTLGQWNHVVATFDGTRTRLWINGRSVAGRESKYKTYEAEGHFRMGVKGRPDLPKFKGMLDSVRVYNRALLGDEAVAHFKAEAAEHDYDARWFNRVKVTPYLYLGRGEVVVEADYRSLLPLRDRRRLTVALSSKAKPDVVLQQKEIDPLPGRPGVVDVTLACAKLEAGDYLARVTLRDGKGARPVEEFTFSYPAKARPLASPAERTVGPLPRERKPTPFTVKMNEGGGFTITINETRYPFESRISWPNGDFNRLTAGDKPYDRGEKSWQAAVREVRNGKYEAKAGGDFYTIQRDVEVFPTHVYVKDTYTNATREDLGLLIHNETPLRPGQIVDSRLSGFERRGRQIEAHYPDYGPTAFLVDTHAGMGIVPIDDVFVVQALPYVGWQDAAGVCTDKFALAPGKSYTLEWAVYPTGSRDYYDFINTFRRVEDRVATVEKTPGYVTSSLHVPARRIVVDGDFIDKRGIDIGIVTCLSFAEDDSDLHIEGIEFSDFPKEMVLLRRQTDALHDKHPFLKVIVHIAHSLYCTNDPDRFADSKVIGPDGKQASWGDGSEFGKDKQAAGWKWWIFYPTPGNSFHDAMMNSVDVLMDELGFDGGFMDGFFAGYMGQWSHDTHLRWDGHSAEIDRRTKTIKRKINSVLLLSQPSMIEYARKIREKGGVVLGNNTVFTRTMAKEKHIIFDCECASGPQLHTAPSVTALAAPTCHTAKAFYRDMLDKLSWGALFISYSDPTFPSGDIHPTFASKQFPMTFEEIRAGMVRGPQRIVTMNSGVYGWAGKRDLHLIHKFDSRGVPISPDSVTTVDERNVRTELQLGEHESAVIEPIPAVLESAAAVNVRVTQYSPDGLRMSLNGRGLVVLRLRSGAMPIKPGAKYRVTAGGAALPVEQKDDTLSVSLTLKGPVELLVASAGDE